MCLHLSLNKYPRIIARAVLPSDTPAEKEAKNKKQFMSCLTSILTVTVDDKQFTITAFKNYCFDGATIPFNIGKGNMKLLVPALFHDIMCDKKDLVNCDRNLSSKIFRELLILCGIPKWKAQVMYLAVDNYQRFMKGWN